MPPFAGRAVEARTVEALYKLRTIGLYQYSRPVRAVVADAWGRKGPNMNVGRIETRDSEAATPIGADGRRGAATRFLLSAELRLSCP